MASSSGGAVGSPDGGEPGALTVDARATLFGFEDQPVRAEMVPRSKAWRVGGAARTFAVFAVVAPFVAVFPPHAVWFLGALVAGGVLARRRYIERFTLLSVDGVCPKCGGRLSAKKGRLKRPHLLPCEGCNHEPALHVPDAAFAPAD